MQMGQFQDIKQDWLLKDSINKLGLIMMKPLVQLLSQPQFESFLPWLLTILGLSDNLTSAMPSYMAFSRKMSTWLSPKASMIPSGHIICANSISPYMGSSRHPEPGLKDSPHNLKHLASMPPLPILPYSHSRPTMIHFISFYTLMISSSHVPLPLS